MFKRISLLIILFLLIPSLSFGAALSNMYITPAGAGDKSGSTWANAMGYGEWETDAEGSAAAGDRYYVAEGTYTLTSDFAITADGSGTNAIKIIGVKSGTSAEPPTSSDYAFGDNRPHITDGGNQYSFIVDNATYIENIRFTSADTAYVVRIDARGMLKNVKIIQTSTGKGVYSGSTNTIINCEISSTGSGGDAIEQAVSTLFLKGSYIHDFTIGVDKLVDVHTILISNVFDTLTTGYDAASTTKAFVVNNTFYNVTTGINAATSAYNVFLNNIFDECTAPAVWASINYDVNVFDYNSWDGDASGNTNVTVGPNSVDSDITLTSPAAGDFTLPDSSAVEGVGLQLNTNTGATGDYNWNIGVDQTDTQAGGGGVNANGAVSVGF